MKKLILLIFFILLMSVSANAQIGKIWIEEDTSYFYKDSVFILTINCDAYLTGAKAIRLDIDIDPNVLSVDTTSLLPDDTIFVELGSMFSTDPEITFFEKHLWSDSARFTVDIAYLPDSATFSGPGEMLILPINTVGFGESDIVITNAYLIDRYGAAIEVQVENSWAKICQFVGDVNADNTFDIADLVYFIEYVIAQPSGPAPNPIQSGNVNCDNEVDIADVVMMVDYMFNNGPAFCDTCI